jgi:hypothetical protein
MSVKLRREVTLEIPTEEMCRILTDALCTSFGAMEHLAVWRVTRTAHGRFRVDMGPPLPTPVVVSKPSAAA